jgi:hypothetical protein
MGGAEFLKQSEIFAFLAAFFLIAIILQQKEAERQRGSQENPPIIRMSEEDESYRFELGSADVSPRFRQAIEKEIIPKLNERSRKFACDAIEVVGHTDGVNVTERRSNLDEKLAASLGSDAALLPGSNMDLGMMRAMAVIRILKANRDAGRLKGVNYFFPYSAGQMIMPDQRLTEADAKTPDRGRRRIEIRLLKASMRRIEEAGR